MEKTISKSQVTENITDVEAAVSFIDQFESEYGTDHVGFHSCSLNEAISEACFAPIQFRKVMALYFHNSEDAFSKMFCPNLISGKIKDLLENSFYLLCWDISQEMFHKSLLESWDSCIDFEDAKCMITEKRAALFILYPIKDSVTVFSMLHGAKVVTKNVLETLQAIEKNFLSEIEDEMALQCLEENTQQDNDIGSEQYQQIIYDRVSDRDYDCFEFDEHEYLKQKLGFSKFGAPASENGYDSKQLKIIEETYKQIILHNNEYAEWKNQIMVSFLYNCLEPLPQEKLSKAKKYPDYNPKTDVLPIPVYVIRKCRGSENPCRIFVDSDNRVYTSWQGYIQRNNLDKYMMVLPKDGRYKEDEEGKVMLEKHLSPSCGIGHVVLKGTDIATTLIGLTSTGIFVAAMIPSVVIAPIALTAAAATGIGVGVYSLIRSAFSIHDRVSHSESMSFANSEARGAYFNIMAGALGFAGAGATTVVSQLAARGINIGQGARVAVNTLSVINIGASGANVANSTYQVIDDWVTDQKKPSVLTMVQLSSAILFFGHAVYNFKTCGTIIEETQTSTLKNYEDSLRSNKHRRMLNKMLRETIKQNDGDIQLAQGEVIKVIRNVSNKNEVFAVLNRNNKLFNKEGIKFAAENGEITLNGISVDLIEFEMIPKSEKAQFLSDLPSTPSPIESKNNISQNLKTVQTIFGMENLAIVTKYGQLVMNGCSFAEMVGTVLKDFSVILQEKILRIFRALIDVLFSTIDINFPRIFSEYFSHIDKEPFSIILKIVVNFLKDKTGNYEIEYERVKLAAQQMPDYNEEAFNEKWGLQPESCNTALFWFERVVNIFLSNGSIHDILLRELVQYVVNNVFEKIYVVCDTLEKSRKREQNTEKSSEKIPCKICGGYYFGKVTKSKRNLFKSVN